MWAQCTSVTDRQIYGDKTVLCIASHGNKSSEVNSLDVFYHFIQNSLVVDW